MNYIRTKLSKKDKEILKEIYNELEEINIPVSFRKTGGGTHHSVKTGGNNQKDARQTCFGKVRYKGKIKKSCSSLKYPHIMSLFKLFIDSHYPNFNFTCVYVNKNTICKKHLDSKNSGESMIVGTGPYTEGKTVLYLNKGEVEDVKKFNIKTSSLIFNGSEIEHSSEPFNGIRYSLVFFK
jgi:hypothetical protein